MGRMYARLVEAPADPLQEQVEIAVEELPGGYILPAASTEAMGGVKKAAATSVVTAADAAPAAAETVTKAEFDALATLANACKKAVNDMISAQRRAGQAEGNAS